VESLERCILMCRGAVHVVNQTLAVREHHAFCRRGRDGGFGANCAAQPANDTAYNSTAFNDTTELGGGCFIG
jgi:hypothetical protein